MAKKQSALVENIQKKIEIAQEAVGKITDESLKTTAFQVVLQKLLMSDEMPAFESAKTPQATKTMHEETKPKAKQPKGPKGRVEALIEDGFFTQKRTIGEVKEALAARGWFHRLEDLNPTLLRLIQERKLRRIKEPENEGGKLIWRYSIW